MQSRAPRGPWGAVPSGGAGGTRRPGTPADTGGAKRTTSPRPAGRRQMPGAPAQLDPETETPLRACPRRGGRWGAGAGRPAGSPGRARLPRPPSPGCPRGRARCPGRRLAPVGAATRERLSGDAGERGPSGAPREEPKGSEPSRALPNEPEREGRKCPRGLGGKSRALSGGAHPGTNYTNAFPSAQQSRRRWPIQRRPPGAAGGPWRRPARVRTGLGGQSAPKVPEGSEGAEQARRRK